MNNPLRENVLIKRICEADEISLEQFIEEKGYLEDGYEILDSIYIGNWNSATKQMLEIYATPLDLARFIQEEKEEGADFDWFDFESMTYICNIYNELKQ